MAIRWSWILWVLAAAVAHAGEPAPATPLHAEVARLYGFRPRDLAAPALAEKSKELDGFWSEVTSAGEPGLEALRAELQREDTPVFFRYDGAKLLLHLSKRPTDHALAALAIGRSDIRDIQWPDYFWTVHALSVEGLDTADAALNILVEDQYSVNVPQHALTLGQSMCLAYLLLPTREAYYADKLVARLFAEQSVTAQESLLNVLGDIATAQGDAAIQRFADDPAQPEASRAHAREILAALKPMGSVPVFSWSLHSYESLKREQRELMARVSDEALASWERLRLRIRGRAAK